MANPLSRVSRGEVSWALNDDKERAWQNPLMGKQPKTRWFLKQWRKHRGLTQDQLAERTNLSKPYISQLETGRRQYTQELLEIFADALRCDVPDLIMRDPTQPEPMWSIWEALGSVQKEQVTEIAKTIKRTGTGG